MTVSDVMTGPPVRSEELRQHRLDVGTRRATLLLVLVTCAFLALTLVRSKTAWVGYLQAVAEASMVGALADWFAVVALFRHPLGIPIPHTAVIVERKDQFATTLGDFIRESFLTPEAIVQRVRSAGAIDRLANWLAEPSNADRISAEVTAAAVAFADFLREDQAHGLLEDELRERVESIPVAPLAGRLLKFVTEQGRHHQVIDAALRGLDRYLNEHREDLRQRLGDESPWWLPGAVEDRIFERLIDGARSVLQAMVGNSDHKLRQELEVRIAQLAVDLQTSPEMRARGEQLKHDVMAQPQVQELVAAFWNDLKEQLRQESANPDSRLRQRLCATIVSVGNRLREDQALRTRVQDVLENGLSYVAEHFNTEIATLVSGTVARWDARETARRLELLLGPDLQFIRINGTVVGAIVGLILHAIVQVLG